MEPEVERLSHSPEPDQDPEATETEAEPVAMEADDTADEAKSTVSTRAPTTVIARQSPASSTGPCML